MIEKKEGFMKNNEFKLEVFFGKHEFSAPYLLTQSDCESMSIGDLLAFELGAKDAFLNEGLGYTEVPDSPELRKSIANLYKAMTPENITAQTIQRVIHLQKKKLKPL